MTNSLLWHGRYLLLMVLSLAIGCSSNQLTVNVQVDGLSSDVVSLAVQSRVDARSFGEQPVGKQLESFVIRLPSGTNGSLTVVIKGLDRSGCSLAEGSTTVPLQGDVQSLSVSLRMLSEPSCMLEILRGGTGLGSVSTIGKDGGDISCGSVCRAVVPPGQAIKLTAEPSDGSYFAGWSGACTGTSPTCTIMSLRDGQSVSAMFAPAQRCSTAGFCWQNPLPAGDALVKVHGVGPNEAWSVGASGVILRWNGTFWIPQLSPVSSKLRGVFGTGPNDFWFVGDSGAIVRWDGKQLRAMSGQSQNLNAVWGSSASDVFIVGAAGTILHFNGTDLTLLPSGTTETLLGVSGTSASDVWIVGHKGTRLHWDGQKLSAQSMTTTDRFASVWARAKNDVWVVGGAQADLVGSIPHGVVLHYDGSTWSKSMPDTVDLLRDVVGTPSGDVWAVGLRGQIWRYHNQQWIPYEGSTGTALWSVWGIGPDDVWVVGEGGTIVHWNGVIFSPFTTAVGGTQDLLSIWGTGPSDIWAVGNGTPLLHFDGSSWSTPAGGQPQRLRSIFGFGAEE